MVIQSIHDWHRSFTCASVSHFWSLPTSLIILRMELTEAFNGGAHGNIHGLLGGTWSPEADEYAAVTPYIVIPFVHHAYVRGKRAPTAVTIVQVSLMLCRYDVCLRTCIVLRGDEG